MKVVSFIGSPDKDGNSAFLAGLLCEQARKRGHSVETFFLYDLNINGCRDCGECKAGTVPFCSQEDDMQALYKSITGSDYIILSTPVFFGHYSGPAKTFLDRWCTFFDTQFKPRFLPEKRIFLLMTCGSPDIKYQHLREYNRRLFCDFFQMQLCGNMIFGDLKDSGDIHRFPEVIKTVMEFGAYI